MPLRNSSSNAAHTFKLKCPTRYTNPVRMVLSSSLIVMLAACGGRDDGENAPVYVGQPADSVSTETLQRNAVTASSDSIGVALSSVLNTMNNSAAVNNIASIPGLGLGAGTAADNPSVFNDPAQPGPLFNADFEQRMRTESSGVFNATMGLSGSASTTRVANSITIDPDENEICQQQTMNDAADLATCTQLLADLTVQIDADSDQSGTINYLFRSEPVAEIQYSPVLASYELKLSGLHSVLNRLNELDGSSDAAPDTMAGSLKFEARVLNATPGTEAASLTFSIPDPVTITSAADGTNLSLGQSKLMEFTANAGTRTASVEVAIGALEFAARSDELTGNPMQRLMMSGMTMRADLSNNGGVLSMSNIGLGNGPLLITVDSMEAMRVTLDSFGYTVNNQNSISLTGDLNFAVQLSNVLGFLDPMASHDSSASYAVSAMSGTVMSELVSGVMRIDQGGPLNFSYSLDDGSSQASGQVVVNQGECFGDGFEDAAIELASCN